LQLSRRADPEAQTRTYYWNCDAVRAPGRRRFSVVRLGYTPHLDRDGDGTGSE